MIMFGSESLSTKDYDYVFKIIVVGDRGVGKSCLIVRFADDKFIDNHRMTIGIDFKVSAISTQVAELSIQLQHK